MPEMKLWTHFKALLAPGLKRKDCVSICNSFVAVIFIGILKELVDAASREACHVLVTLDADKNDTAVPLDAMSASTTALVQPLD